MATTTLSAYIISSLPSLYITAPEHTPSSIMRSLQGVLKYISTPLAIKCFSIARYISCALSVPICLMGHSTSLSPASVAFCLIFATLSGWASPSTFSSAPNLRYMSSTYLIVSCASSLPMRSGKSPPTSALSDNLPSENAPAPEKPVVIAQFLHFIHTPHLTLGQYLLSIDSPFSTIRIRLSDCISTSSNAVNIPAGPAPIINTSVFIFPPYRPANFSLYIIIPINQKYVNTACFYSDFIILFNQLPNSPFKYILILYSKNFKTH